MRCDAMRCYVMLYDAMRCFAILYDAVMQSFANAILAKFSGGVTIDPPQAVEPPEPLSTTQWNEGLP